MFDKLSTQHRVILDMFSEKVTELKKKIIKDIIDPDTRKYAHVSHNGKLYNITSYDYSRSTGNIIIDSSDNEALYKNMDELVYLDEVKETVKSYLTVILNKCETEYEFNFVLGNVTDESLISSDKIDHILNVKADYDKEIRFIKKMKMASTLL